MTRVRALSSPSRLVGSVSSAFASISRSRSPLLSTAGEPYVISFQVSLSDFCGYSTPDIGAAFSANQLGPIAGGTSLVIPKAVEHSAGTPYEDELKSRLDQYKKEAGVAG